MRDQVPGRALLTEVEAKAVLTAAGIPVVPTTHASSEAEAVSAAQSIGYPVVLKLHSTTLTHKTDVGGVQLDLPDEAAVRNAWQQIKNAVPAADFAGVSVQRMIKQRGIELIVGITTDAQFGPVLLFGAGGTSVEVFQDRALALPPLSPALVRDWIAQTKINKALHGIRGQPPVNLDALTQLLIHVADLSQAAPEIMEMDINPILATPEGMLALDARIKLRRPPL